MPTSLGPAEILVILFVALIVLGPKRLPEAGRQVGKAIAEVRKWSQGFQDEVRSAIDPNAAAPTYAAPPPPAPDPPAVAPDGMMPAAADAPPLEPAFLPDPPALPDTAPAAGSGTNGSGPEIATPPPTEPPAGDPPRL